MIEQLSEQERAKIIAFNSDEVLIEAVRKVLLAAIYANGTIKKDQKSDPTKNAAFGLVSLASQGFKVSDEELGSDLRAQWAGISYLEQGLRELAKIKKEPVSSEPKENPAI